MGLFQTSSEDEAEKTRKAALLMAQLEMQYNMQEAAKSRAWSKNLANTAHQREVMDLRAAGLNPILSANSSGSAVPSASTASVGGLASAVGSAYAQGINTQKWVDWSAGGSASGSDYAPSVQNQVTSGESNARASLLNTQNRLLPKQVRSEISLNSAKETLAQNQARHEFTKALNAELRHQLDNKYLSTEYKQRVANLLMMNEAYPDIVASQVFKNYSDGVSKMFGVFVQGAALKHIGDRIGNKGPVDMNKIERSQSGNLLRDSDGYSRGYIDTSHKNPY